MLNRPSITLLALLVSSSVFAEGLPFDRSTINRYSLDGVPRSISIRQGDTWLGYDLERATVMKVWRPRPGEAGLTGSFTVRSVGETLFEDKSDQGWILNGEAVDVRYLGCTQGKESFVLRWELSNGTRTLRLHERITTDSGDGVWRELRVTGLEEADSLEVPAASAESWNLNGNLTTGSWIQITLS